VRALVFDSWFDQYRGVVILVYVVDGKLAPGMKVKLMASGGGYQIEQLGVFTPKPLPVGALHAGEVGFVIAGIKKVSDTKIGDTLTDEKRPAPDPLPGFKEVKPMVFAGLFPVVADQYAELRGCGR
jgi:GTP-binding protein LepA